MLTRLEMQDKLARAFPPEQTTSLVEVLDVIREAEIQRAADTRELKQGLAALTGEVRQLAAAQRHTDDAVTQLSRAVERLAETVNRGLADLREAVGSLSQRFGFNLEEFVAALLPPYLERHFAITGLTPLERRYFDLSDGGREEVDLIGEGRRDGQVVTVLVECHATAGGSEVRRFARKLKAVEPLIATPEIARVMVAMNVHPTATEAGPDAGVWVIPYSRINRERG